MRTDPRLLLRGFAKFVAVVVVAGLAGAGIGIALAELSGDDAADTPLLPATTGQASTKTAATTTSPSRTSTTSTTAAVYRVPRVQVLSALLGPVSESSGRALAAVRTRVTNRGNRALKIENAALLSGDDEVALGDSARQAAGALLRPIAPGESATGVLRFSLPSAVAQRLTATPSARLRVANRTVSVNLTAG